MTIKGIRLKIFTVLLATGFVVLYLVGIKNKGVKDSIQSDGIETIGTIVNRTKGLGNGDITTFGVHFDFYVNEELIKSHQMLNDKSEYDNAIVGMKYRVKYLPDKPYINSIIFINKPIAKEFRNIPKERERILKTYENAKVFLKKNAQPLNEINYITEQ